MNFRNVSYWNDTVPRLDEPSDPPHLPDEVDVAIIGAGFTGLWTAYYLSKKDPRLNIAILEAETPGFGASGRNGGWCSASLWGIEGLMATPDTHSIGSRLQQAMWDTIDEVDEVCTSLEIDCDFNRGGTLIIANSADESQSLKHLADMYNAINTGPSYEFLEEKASRARFNVENNKGALFNPYSATLNPVKLIRHLISIIETRGVKIYPHSPVKSYSAGQVDTQHNRVAAQIIIKATEGYSGALQGPGLKIQPLYSMVLATEPLTDSIWQDIGLHNREVFGDTRSLFVYGQRTADNRLIFGGRAGFFYGAKKIPIIRAENPGVAKVEKTLRDMLPQLQGAQLTHGWGGLMGVHQNWRPALSYNPESGTGSAGGYVGNGIATANLAGRTLSDLIMGETSSLTELPWVTHEGALWEP